MTGEWIRDGLLERFHRPGDGDSKIRLLECPAPGCDRDFAPRDSRSRHLESHAPEDFGLTPLGDRSGLDAAPLWPDEAPPAPRDGPAVGAGGVGRV